MSCKQYSCPVPHVIPAQAGIQLSRITFREVCRVDSRLRGNERVKKSKQLTQRRKGAKSRKGEVHSLLCDLCAFATLRETALSVHGLIHTFNDVGFGFAVPFKWHHDPPRKTIDVRRGGVVTLQVFGGPAVRTRPSDLSDFGLCATDVREPRQVRKEATVTSLSVCPRSTRSLTQFETRRSKLENRNWKLKKMENGTAKPDP